MMVCADKKHPIVPNSTHHTQKNEKKQRRRKENIYKTWKSTLFGWLNFCFIIFKSGCKKKEKETKRLIVEFDKIYNNK